jgi:small subunit ribosomal protein S15
LHSSLKTPSHGVFFAEATNVFTSRARNRLGVFSFEAIRPNSPVPNLLAKTQFLLILAGSKENMATETKNFQSFQIHDKDTGSADVQIALLTQRINQLTDHLKTHVKDHSSRRGLLMMVAKRRSLLDYLKDTATDRYKVVLEKLNLRK